MHRLSLPLLWLTFWVGLAGGQPTISTSDLRAQSGDEVTLAGCNFGTNALVYRWMNVEGVDEGEYLPWIGSAPHDSFPSGFWSGPGRDGGPGHYISNRGKAHSGVSSLKATVDHDIEESFKAMLSYLPLTDTSDTFTAPSTVYLSYWQYSDYISSATASTQTMHKMAGMSNADSPGNMQGDQEGGFYWTQQVKLVDNAWQITGENETAFYPVGAHFTCGCWGDPTHTCGSTQCQEFYNESIFPGTSAWDNYKFRHLETGANSYANGTQPRNYLPNKTWTRYELFVQASSDTTVRDGTLEIRISNANTSPMVSYAFDQNLVTHFSEEDMLATLGSDVRQSAEWPSPGVYKNIFIYNLFGHLSTGKADFYLDDIYVGMGDGARARVELGNAATWADCTLLEIQQPASWTDNEIVFDLNTGAFGNEQWLWLYVVNADGDVNAAGRPIYVGRSSPPIIINPHKPKNPRLDEPVQPGGGE